MTSSTPETEDEIEPWQVRIAYIEFPDKPGKGKARPILVVNKAADVVHCLKITSAGPSDAYQRIELEYQELNLAKPSWLQIAPVYKVPSVQVGPLVSKITKDFADELTQLIKA